MKRIFQMALAILLAVIAISSFQKRQAYRASQALLASCLQHTNLTVELTDWCISLQLDVESGARRPDGTLVTHR